MNKRQAKKRFKKTYGIKIWQMRMPEKKLIKSNGYKGCKNCQHQISPLRSCEWAEQGGSGCIHVICPMWDKKKVGNKDVFNT